MERLCKNCKHYWYRGGSLLPRGEECHALDREQHPIYGGPIDGIDAGIVRLTLCGWKDPKFWEPKGPEKP